MKIRYRMTNGFTSTAYLDCDTTDVTWLCNHADDTHPGVDKHTDEPITVQWNGHEWVQTGDTP